MAAETKTERGLAIWQPFRELEEMERRFEELFSRPFFPSLWRRPFLEGTAWSPAMEVIEKEDKYIVRVELPGVKEEDVDVSISGDVLTISGEKKEESEVKKKGYYYSESAYGAFSRAVTIPSSVDTTKIEACYDKGILEITLPKAVEVKPKKIKVTPKKKEEKPS